MASEAEKLAICGRELPARWPRKPPKGWTCDGNVACPTPEECAAAWKRMVDPGGTVHIHHCQEPAVETVLMMAHFEMFMCEHHAEVYEAKGQVVRNPRRKQ